MKFSKLIIVFFLVILSLSCSASGTLNPRSILEGQWEAIVFTADSEIPYSTFQLEIKTSSSTLTGKYCFITHSGNKIDCDPDSGNNIVGIIENKTGVANVEFHSFFGARGGKAKVYMRDGSLHWEITTLPTGGDFYGPKSSVLHRVNKPAT